MKCHRCGGRMHWDYDRAKDGGKRILTRVVKCINCGERLWPDHVPSPGFESDEKATFSWDEAWERIQTCVSCPLPECKGDLSPQCGLRALPAKKHFVARLDKPKRGSNQALGKTQLGPLIKKSGLPVNRWCEANGIGAHQLRDFEFFPPEAPTELSRRIEQKLRKDGIIWTGRTCNTL